MGRCLGGIEELGLTCMLVVLKQGFPNLLLPISMMGTCVVLWWQNSRVINLKYCSTIDCKQISIQSNTPVALSLSL